jgi:hypothetical protein
MSRKPAAFFTSASRYLDCSSGSLPAILFDVVTLGYVFLRHKERFIRASRWLQEAGRIFAEENVHYSVDDKGGVHFRFDEEFARGNVATIAALQTPRYANARAAFELEFPRWRARHRMARTPSAECFQRRNAFSD